MKNVQCLKQHPSIATDKLKTGCSLRGCEHKDGDKEEAPEDGDDAVDGDPGDEQAELVPAQPGRVQHLAREKNQLAREKIY